MSGFNWAFHCGNAVEIARPRRGEKREKVVQLDMLSIHINYQVLVEKGTLRAFIFFGSVGLLEKFLDANGQTCFWNLLVD